MPLNCEGEGPANFGDTSLGDWLGNDGFADLAECCEFDAGANDRAVGKSLCRLAGLFAAHAIELVWRGFALSFVALVLDELSQIVTPYQDWTFSVHHRQAIRDPIASRAG